MRFVSLKPSTMIGRSVMQAFDEKVSFISFVRLWWGCSYKDSDEAASLALKFSKNIPNSKILYFFKYWMFRAQYNWTRRYFEKHPDAGALCWNGLNGSRRVFIEAARHAGAHVVIFESAPLPGRLTIDTKGVNFANSLPRNSQFYINWQLKNPQHQHSWISVRQSIVSRMSSKNKNVKQLTCSDTTLDQPYIFVPLQVQTDTQIKVFGGCIKSVEDFVCLLDKYATELPHGWVLRVKEHPSSPVPYRLDELIKNRSRWVVDNTTDTMQLVRHSKAVVTVNSSVGLEALFFGKPVITVGQAFYGFEDISYAIQDPDELRKLFADPIGIFKFKEREVTAFLNYLCVVYYPQVDINNGIVVSIDPIWLKSFKDSMYSQSREI